MIKKTNLLKGISILFSVILLSLLIDSPSVFASESMYSEDTSSTSEVTMYVSNVNPKEMEEFCAHMVFDDTLKEGEERVLGTINGEEFCVRVTNITETSTSTYSYTSTETTTSRDFIFYTKNILGVKKDVLKVKSDCKWIKGSRIISLTCTYTTYVSDILCSWNDNYKMANETLHTLGLDITYNGSSGIVFFGAGLDLDRQTLTLNCSADEEL